MKWNVWTAAYVYNENIVEIGIYGQYQPLYLGYSFI